MDEAEREPPQPGKVLAGLMEGRGWAQADLALVLGVSRTTVSQIITGRRGITTGLAQLLGAAFGTEADAEYWLRLDTQRQIWKLRECDVEPIRQRAALRGAVPGVARSPLPRVLRKAERDQGEADRRDGAALRAENGRLRLGGGQLQAREAELREVLAAERDRCQSSRYALFCGGHYYPGGGWNDFRRTAATIEAARYNTQTDYDHRSGEWWHVVDLWTGRVADSDPESREWLVRMGMMDGAARAASAEQGEE